MSGFTFQFPVYDTVEEALGKYSESQLILFTYILCCAILLPQLHQRLFQAALSKLAMASMSSSAETLRRTISCSILNITGRILMAWAWRFSSTARVKISNQEDVKLFACF